MYVEVMVPKQIKQKYPIVFFHGNGQSGNHSGNKTPDGRPGWAWLPDCNQRYVDVHGGLLRRAGVSPYVPDMDGKLGLRTALTNSATDLDEIPYYPAAGFSAKESLHAVAELIPSKKGTMGDPVFFDNFIKGQMQFIFRTGQFRACQPGVALLDKSVVR